MRIGVLINDATVPAGRLASVAEIHGHELVEVALYDGAVLPSLDSIDAVVVLGGEMGVYNDDDYPYLRDEMDFLSDAVDADIPTLGLCLGGQLIAHALGGRAYRADRPEVVIDTVTLTPEGRGDPVAEALASARVVRFHQDTWETPPEATLTATGGGFPQMFRMGSAIAIQPHPEVNQEYFRRWATSPESEGLRRRAGADGQALVAEYAASEAEATGLAERFFTAWFDEARESSTR